jgi:hypothetical protein
MTNKFLEKFKSLTINNAFKAYKPIEGVQINHILVFIIIKTYLLVSLIAGLLLRDAFSIDFYVRYVSYVFNVCEMEFLIILLLVLYPMIYNLIVFIKRRIEKK